jgi:DNA ligase-associated metallophosphoesterase
MEFKTVQILNNNFELYPDKYIYWKDKKILIISDVHLGKGKHFRKHGIAIPDVHDEIDLEKIKKIIYKHQPKEVIFLGDLFHSSKNNSFGIFSEFIHQHKHINFHLVEGNHDIIHQTEFEQIGIHFHIGEYLIDDFIFVHDINDWTQKDKYAFSGHIHPAIYLQGKARQGIRLPIFYFNDQFSILPSFGSFTGHAIINTNPKDGVYGIVQDKIIIISELN